MKKINKISAFTLAETMIVLTVIAIIAGIILPVAFKAKPDEDLAKFKKYDAIVHTAIKELSGTDKYFMPGNMSLTPQGTNFTQDCYFAKAFADVIGGTVRHCGVKAPTVLKNCTTTCGYTDSSNYTTFVNNIDNAGSLERIILRHVVKYEVDFVELGDTVFGISHLENGICNNAEGNRVYTHGDEGLPACHDENNLDTHYAYISFQFDHKMDFSDGVDTTDSSDVMRGKTRFAYAFSADGKLIPGRLAEEWQNKELK